jgi:type II secretion system protein H
LRTACTPRRAAGFTFVELLVVIAIISLMSSIVVVNLDGISAPSRLDAAAREIGNQVLELEDLAELTGRPYAIEIDVDNQRYRVIGAPSPTEVPDPRDREEATFYGEWRDLDASVRIEEISFSSTDVERGGTVLVTFSSDGEISPSGFVAFLASDRLPQDEGVSLEVAGLTGLVSYHRGRIKAEEIRKADDF